MIENLDLTDKQTVALRLALDFYIRLGLGQFTELATRFDLMYGKNISSSKLAKLRKLCNEMEKVIGGGIDGDEAVYGSKEASAHVLNAWLIEAQMLNDRKLIKNLKKQIAIAEKKEVI